MTDRQEGSVDWEHWTRLDRWELNDAICLLLGVDPDTERSLPPSMIPAERRRAAERIAKYAIASSSACALILHGASQWGDLSVTPSEWIRWARTKRFDIPPELACFDPFQSDSDDDECSAKSAGEKPLHTKEKNTLLKLVIGMAVKGFDYDPLASRNDAVAQIAASLESLGIGLDPDTVRSKLREGAALLPSKHSKSNR